MVQFTTVSLVVMVIIAPFAAAENCRTGLNYCGYNLLKKGNYYSQINTALKDAHQSTDSSHINNALFDCNGGADGAIAFIRFCGSGCVNGGTRNSDYC